MRKFLLCSIVCLFVVAGCNDPKKPSKTNFTHVINQFLEQKGKPCFNLYKPLPADVSNSELKVTDTTSQELTSLEQAGLLKSSDTTMTETPIWGFVSKRTVPGKHFELTEEGKKYFQKNNPDLAFGGGSSTFCFAQASVNSIVKWTEPENALGQTVTAVTYTYKLDHVASWALRPDVQKSFSDIRRTLDGAQKREQEIGLRLTNIGWEIPQS